MNPFRHALGAGIAAVTLLALGGCATLDQRVAAPAQRQPIVLKHSGEQLSTMTELPIGTYRVPDSHVIVTGHQKNQSMGVLFGALGAAMVHAGNAAAGADAVKAGEQQLRIRVDAPLEAAIREISASPAYAGAFSPTEQPGLPRLLVTPAVVMTFVSGDKLQPGVILKAVLMGADSKPVWMTHYTASSGEPRTLTGPAGWLRGDGTELRKTVLADLSTAMHTLARDVSRPYPRGEEKLVVVQGHFPFSRERLQLLGQSLAEDDRHLVFLAKRGGGVSVLDKAVITRRPATHDDPLYKVLE